MGYDPSVQLMDENGIRLDGRTANDIRDIKIECGVLHRAVGSCYLEWGENKVMVGVYGPQEAHPRHKQQPARAIIQCHYNMAAFSVSDRKRPGLDRRSQEISKLCSEALEHVVFTEHYPRSAIQVNIEILQASAGTRCAGLTAASVALADAGIPMRDFVPSVAVGKIADTLVVDLGQKEDNFGQADVPMAWIPRTDEFVLLQMDGQLTQDELKTALEMGKEASKKVYDLQVAAVKAKYN